MAKAQKRIVYRYLHREVAGLGDAKLIQGIQKSLLAKRGGDIVGQRARARVADLAQEGQLTLLNNLSGDDPKETVFGGEIILYRKGFDVPAIEEALESESKSFNVKQFQTDGTSKPVEGALYFVVIGDHVGIVASNAVTTRWLERYLTWLLKDIGDVIEGENFIELNAKIELGGQKGKTTARAMTIHPQSNERPAGDQSRLAERAVGKGATVLEILRMLGFGDNAIAAVEKDVPPGGRLEGDFRVFIKEGNKTRVLSEDTVDHAFRNLPEDQLEFEAKSGRIKGSKIQLSEPIRINQIGAMLDPQDALEKIVEQLYKWNQNGDINLGST